MKLLIHDLNKDEWERISEEYRNWTVVSETGPVSPCIGCFRCWTGGTGECVFRDGYENMCSLIHQADEMVVMSRYTYGGFSIFVKSVFDRSIGYVLPEFETAYGEMHHKKRFPEDKPVTFVFRGSHLSEEDKEKAVRYAHAVCRNLRGTVKDVIFEDSPEEAEPLPYTPPSRTGILLIDCSLRGVRSNTAVFLDRLGKELKMPVETVSLSSQADPRIISEYTGKAETVVLGVPLYVDGLPAPALRLMETVRKDGTGRQCRLYAVVNNGLYESRQNENLLSMIRDWCAESGLEYRGALAIGAGEVIGTLMRHKTRVLWPARNALNGLSRLAEKIRTDSEAGENYADPYLFPRWLYILIANVNWQRLKKAARRSRKG